MLKIHLSSYFSVCLLSVFFLSSFASLHAQDTTVISIDEEVLEDVYYHQEVFEEPTRLVFPNLTHVNQTVYFHQNENIVGVEMPALTTVGGYVYFHENLELSSFQAPALSSISQYLYLSGNEALTEADFCALQQILPLMEDGIPPMWPEEIPYYFLNANSPAIDGAACFSLGAPENLSLSNNSLFENLEPGAVIGTLSADSNYPDGVLTYYLPDWDDQEDFYIEGDQLLSNASFDAETQSSYDIILGVFNQLGELIETEVTIEITDVGTEEIVTIEITDSVLNEVYYHQDDFAGPTRLLFTNLHTVSGIVYFHENNNLVEVEFPLLETTGSYFYFHGNAALTALDAPTLETVGEYVYVSQNTALVELDICNLNEITPTTIDTGSIVIPYYFVQDNTAEVDLDPMCFSLGGPTDLALSANTIQENLEVGTWIGDLSALSNYPDGSFYYYLPDWDDQENFSIVDNQLLSNITFDFEIQNSYDITIAVFNQLGEIMETEVSIEITDLIDEGLVTVWINDTVMDEIYYHQENFLTPTRLYFTNLTKVNGYVYFHENVNLVEVEMPLLESTGDYVYFHGNDVLESVSAPIVDSIYTYLYASQNDLLVEFDFCALEHILPIIDEEFPEDEQEPYYYLEGNDLLDVDLLCLNFAKVEYTGFEAVIETDQIQIGAFLSDDGSPMKFAFIDDEGKETERDDLEVVDNELRLTNSIESYAEQQFDVPMVIYSDHNIDASTGLQQRTEMTVFVDLLDLEILSGLNELDFQMDFYPNPTIDFLNVDASEACDIELYSSEGRLVLERNLDLGENQLDLRDLEKGVYFIQMNGERRQTVRVVKF